MRRICLFLAAETALDLDFLAAEKRNPNDNDRCSVLGEKGIMCGKKRFPDIFSTPHFLETKRHMVEAGVIHNG